MKRVFSILLVVLLVLSLCACGGKETAKGLQVGFARENITPTSNVWLMGGGDPNRISESKLDELFVTCVALYDGNTTFLVFTTDAQNAVPAFTREPLEKISEETGVPFENIMVHATHSHSTPGYIVPSREGIEDALKIYQEGLVVAAKNAIADLAPATIASGSTQAEGLTFVRHYKLSNDTYAGSNFGDFNSGTIVDHAVEADTTVQLIRFTREGDKKDVLLMNLGVHATFQGSTHQTVISADFPSPARIYVENNADCHVAYFMSAGGNQEPTSMMASKNHNLSYFQYGERLGQIVVDALPTLESVASGDIHVASDIVTLEANKSDSARLADAEYVFGIFQQSGSSVARPIARQYGFTSHYEARAVIDNSKLGDTHEVEMWAISIGEMSMIFAPYEMFSESGRFIRENSPYKNTFIITNTNDSRGYIPSEFGYEINCYEAYSSKAKAGSGEIMAQAYVDLLTELKAN